MGQRPRPKPKHLAAKLLAIRRKLSVSQCEMEKLLNFQISTARITEYEHGTREPNLLVLLSYARLAEIPLEQIIDDDIDLTV